MAKKKKGILEHLGFKPADYPYEDEEDTTVDEKNKEQDGVAELRAQVAGLQQLIESNNQANTMLLASLTNQQSNQNTQVTVPELKLEYKDLPDPTMEPEAYAKAIAEQTRKAVTDYTTSLSRADAANRQRSNSVDQLWDAFSNQYEDYADDPEKVEFAATKVARDLQSRNIDVEKYMLTQRDTFFKDVVKQMDAVFGTTKADDTDNDEVDDEEDNRTAGVYGGMASKAGRRKLEADDPGDMVKDMHDLQRKSGFF